MRLSRFLLLNSQLIQPKCTKMQEKQSDSQWLKDVLNRLTKKPELNLLTLIVLNSMTALVLMSFLLMRLQVFVSKEKVISLLLKEITLMVESVLSILQEVYTQRDILQEPLELLNLLSQFGNLEVLLEKDKSLNANMLFNTIQDQEEHVQLVFIRNTMMLRVVELKT